MKTKNSLGRTFAVYKILKEETDQSHKISLPELIETLKDLGYPCERKSVYASFDALREMGVTITLDRKEHIGYRMNHLFSPAEATLLIDAVNQSQAISQRQSKILTDKIANELSMYDRDLVKPTPAQVLKTENEAVLLMIERLLKAISTCSMVDFRYFDITITKEKKYRRNRQPYHLAPYAVICHDGRYYCVFYSDKYKDYAIYRIDKMDNLVICEETFEPLNFSIEDYMRSTFDMYSGDATTITLRIPTQLTNVIYDEFGKNVIIRSYNDKFYEVSIRTAITPTLISWLLSFYKEITVLAPQDLITEIQSIASTILDTYKGN